MNYGLAMPHHACVLGSTTKQQHGNAPFPKPLHYVSSLWCGWQWLQCGHPWCRWWCIWEDLILDWMQREGGAGRGKNGAHPLLPDTGVQCSGLIFLLHCLSGLHKLGHHQIETVAHFYPKWGLQNGVFQLNKRLRSNWKKTALSV